MAISEGGRLRDNVWYIIYCTTLKSLRPTTHWYCSTTQETNPNWIGTGDLIPFHFDCRLSMAKSVKHYTQRAIEWKLNYASNHDYNLFLCCANFTKRIIRFGKRINKKLTKKITPGSKNDDKENTNINKRILVLFISFIMGLLWIRLPSFLYK